MASKYTYHAAFVPAPQAFLRRTADLLATFVACGGRAGPGRPGAKMYPNRGVSSLPWDQGGIRFPDTHATAIALQASVVSRLLTPRPAAWKGIFIQWLGRPPAWVQAHPGVPFRDIDTWGLGARAIFCTARLPLHSPSQDARSGIPARVLSYIRAIRRLYPHREGPTASFTEVMAEPLFYNAPVTGRRGAPLGGPSWRQYAQGGVRRVSDLRRLLRPPAPGHLGLDVPQAAPEPPPQAIVEGLLRALPPAWQALVLQPEAPIPDWSAWEGDPGFFLRRLDPVSPGTAMMLQEYSMQWRGFGTTGQAPQASWWSQPTWGPPFWARPSWMSGTAPAQGGLWIPPRGRSSSQQGIRGPLTLGPEWWAIPPSSPSPPPSQLKGGGMSGSGRHRRATRPACPSGRPFRRMTGTLLPRRSQDFGRRSNVNSGRWAACPPPAPLPHANGVATKLMPPHPPPSSLATC
jgi:hypothetical protein